MKLRVGGLLEWYACAWIVAGAAVGFVFGLVAPFVVIWWVVA